MPKQPAKKATTEAATKPAGDKPGKEPTAKNAMPTAGMAEGNAAIVHSCIRGCAGHNNFGPNDQLKNIPADAQCVQVCIIDRTGKPVLVSDTDTENDIVGML